MMNPADLQLLAPEIFLLTATCALLMVDLFVSDARRGLTHFLAVLTLLATAALVVRSESSPTASTAFGGMFIADTVGETLKLFALLVSAAAMIYAKPYLADRKLFKGEFHVLVLFAVLGICVLVSAGSLITVYLGLELLALSSYALVAMDRDSRRGSEAAIKYFVLGALASGMLLYGMSMVYGATGTLDLASIHAKVPQLGDNRTLMLVGVVFIVVGIAFKFGAAPFHMWLPDVYQGAPTAVTLFIGSAPKLAAFGMAFRLLEGGAGAIDGEWREILAWLAVASLAVGNVIAIAQSNIKRMLAYSTISHVGFLLMGLANASPSGYAAAMFYAISYALMAAAGFASVMLLSRNGYEAEQISDFAGLARRNPMFAFWVLLVMGSLAGFPPLFGFWAKWAVLKAAVDGGMLWLALVGGVFAVIGAFYYLRIIKVMYFDGADDHAKSGVISDPQFRVLLAANAALMLGLGLFSGPLLAWCRQAMGV